MARKVLKTDSTLQVKRLFAISSFEFPLNSRGRAVVFLLAVGVPGLFLSYKTVVIAVASKMGESSDAGELLRAVTLDPANPELHYKLGMADCYSLDHSQPEEGLGELRQATELDPAQPAYWSALASACDSLGDRACADQATERTLLQAPMTPRYRWDAANHDLAEGRSSAALAQFRRLLELDPAYAPGSFRLCLELVPDPWSVYQRVLAGQKNPRLNFTYINYLVAHGQGAKACPVWQATLALDQHFPYFLAEPYLAWLVRYGPGQQAASAWKDLERHGILKKSSADSSDNLVFNSGFEQPLLNAGFGWRIQRESYTRVSLDDSGAYQGRRFLRVDFTVSRNGNDLPVYEIVPVKPDHTYLLQAYARADSISSDSGPRLRVTDPDCASCLDVSTGGAVGTTGWHRVSVGFSTGPTTRLVQISVWRPRSLTFPTDISGTYGLDAVSLKDATNQEAQKATPHR